MKSRLNVLLIVGVFTLCLPTLSGVHLSKLALLRVAHSLNANILPRTKRQVITDPQPHYPLLSNVVLNVPIPTNIGFFPGQSKTVDKCDRDEILMEDGTCQSILKSDQCSVYEEVLVDPNTNKGFCAPRLCPPDRVFVHVTQQCHDPRDTTVCPPGRELYYSAFGTSVCTCPDGTVEGDDDLDDDVCELVLGKSLACLPGQSTSDSQEDESEDISTNNGKKVFWFKDFQSPPECLPDPCKGLNLNRNPNSLPFVPSQTGECFQLGQSEGVCPSGLFYSLALDDLRGECNSLEDAGYNIFDIKDIEFLINKFGPTIAGNNAPPIQPGVSDRNTSQLISNGKQTLLSDINVQDNLVTQNIITPSQSGGGIDKFSKTGQISRPKPEIGTQSNFPTHHLIKIESNGTTVSNKITHSGISTNNILFNQNNKQQPLIQQNQQNNQRPFNQVSGPTPFQQQNNQRPISQQDHQSLLGQQTIQQIGQSPLKQQNNQKPFNQVGGQTPFHQQNNHSPIINQQSHQTPLNQQIIQHSGQTPFSQGGGQRPFSHQNSQSPPSQQSSQRPSSNDGPKQICSFIQSAPSNFGQSGGIQGQKVCTNVQPDGIGSLGQQVSIEVGGGSGSPHLNSPEILGGLSAVASVEMMYGRSFDSYGYRFGRSLGLKPKLAKLIRHFTILSNGKKIHHLVRRSKDLEEESQDEMQLGQYSFMKDRFLLEDSEPTKLLSRKKRNPLPFASPSNVFETRLLGCRPGAARDINAKCRNTVLPARIPKQRGTRAAPPIPPTPSCPSGAAFNIRRQCVPRTTAQNSIIAHNLG